jgi:hypothetical protein
VLHFSATIDHPTIPMRGAKLMATND